MNADAKYVVTAQYAPILIFLAAASGVMVWGVPSAFVLRRWLGSPRWTVPAVFLAAMGAGVLAALLIHLDPRRQPDAFEILALLCSFGNISPPVWKLWTARREMGPLLHGLPCPGLSELIWSGRVIMVMAALFFVLAEISAMRIGWLVAIYACFCALMIGSIGYHISNSLGRVEFRAGGVVSRGVFYPWAKLGKFEWMPAGLPVLRIQVRGRYERSDVRIACSDDPEINAILVAHGLVRW